MGGQGGKLPLLLLLLSLDVLGATITDVAVTVSTTLPTSLTPTETTVLLPTTNSTTTATVPSSSPETSAPEVLTDAFKVSTVTLGERSPEVSGISTLQAKGSTAHNIPGSPSSTAVDPSPTGLELTTSTPTPTPTAMKSNCAQTTTDTPRGTSLALAVTSFGVKRSTLPSPTSAALRLTSMGPTLRTSTSQGPAMTLLLGNTSLDETSTTTSDTTATTVTSTVVSRSTSAPNEPVATTPGSSIPTAPQTLSDTTGTTTKDVTTTVPSALSTSSIPMGTSALLSATAATIPPFSPETTQERSSISPETHSTSSPTTPAPAATSTKPSASPLDTTTIPDTRLPGSNPTPSQLVETISGITPGISTMTEETTLNTSAAPETLSAATDASLFLSLRLTVPLDLGNTTVQELVLSKLHEDLQTAFPCAGLALKWRGKRRT
ncbi:uncharacterized protein [Heliangelus exortis]|uniref:uncharacterized protein isoform X2 n=1 Tax=Heliangelus exortis TaxID=472823 RepID=UPI003A8F0050